MYTSTHKTGLVWEEGCVWDIVAGYKVDIPTFISSSFTVHMYFFFAVLALLRGFPRAT